MVFEVGIKVNRVGESLIIVSLRDYERREVSRRKENIPCFLFHCEGKGRTRVIQKMVCKKGKKIIVGMLERC